MKIPEDWDEWEEWSEGLSLFFFCLNMFLIAIGIIFSSCKEVNSDSYQLSKADSLIATQPDSALQILRSVQLPEKLSKEKQARYALLTTRAQNKLGIPETNDSLIRGAVEYYRDEGNRELEMQAYYYWGDINRNARQMDLAVQCFLHALKVIPKECENTYLGAIYGKLGACYVDQELYEDAMKMYRKAYDVYHKQGKKNSLAYACRGIAFTFLGQLQPDSALAYYKEALEIAQNAGNKRRISILYEDMARVYDWKEEYQSAYKCILFSLNNSVNEKERRVRYYLKGRLLGKLGQVDSARHYLNVAKNAGIYEKIGSYNELYELEKKVRNYPKAIVAADSLIILFDSLRNTRKVAEIAKTIGLYEAELYKQKLSARYKIAGTLLLCVFLFIVAAFLWLDRQRKKKYFKLQNELTSLRSDMMRNVVDENIEEESTGEYTHASFEKRFARKLALCLKLFYQTEIYQLYKAIEKDGRFQPVRIAVKASQKKDICESLYENFSDVMTELKIQCPALTKQDLLYCLFWALKCPKQAILACTGISEGALKTRKSRVREKIGDELFDRLFVNEKTI